MAAVKTKYMFCPCCDEPINEGDESHDLIQMEGFQCYNCNSYYSEHEDAATCCKE